MAGKNPPKMWVYSPRKPKPSAIPDALKTEVELRAQLLVETVLKPRCVKPPPPKEYEINYVVDVYTKWYRSYFYFCAKYATSSPRATVPFFEAKQARMEHVGDGKFNLAYFRHTGQWYETETGLSLEKCLDLIKNDPLYFVC